MLISTPLVFFFTTFYLRIVAMVSLISSRSSRRVLRLTWSLIDLSRLFLAETDDLVFLRNRFIFFWLCYDLLIASYSSFAAWNYDCTL